MLVETNIIYKYRAFGASPDHDRTITTATVDLDLTDLRTTHAIGETVTLEADNPEKFGEEQTEYTVLHRWSLLSQSDEEIDATLSALVIIVGDPDA